MTWRLPLLLTLLAAIVAMRWWDPLADPATEVVHAVERRVAPTTPQAARAAEPVSALPRERADETDPAGGTRAAELADAGDAFVVRTPPPLPPPPPAPPPPRPQVVAPVTVAAPAAPAPAPPALQVIGTWRDERGLSVFVVGPGGVVQARIGDTLLAEYQVMQVSAQHLQLKHLSSQRDISLIVPASRSSTR